MGRKVAYFHFITGGSMTVVERCKFLLLFVCLILVSGPSVAQTERALESRVSVCVDPATPPQVARSEEDRKGKECAEWSQIGSTSTVLDVLKFVDCKNPKAPLTEFLRAVLRTWNGQFPARNPVTSVIYKSPGEFQLRPLRPGESRVDSLIVWKGSIEGMAALVVGDENEPGAKLDLKRLKLLYPAGNSCGKLEEISAEGLANNLVKKKIIEKPDDYKLIVARRPRLFWNHWIEKSVEKPDSSDEEPAEVSTNDYFLYKISFSALDFEAHRRGDKEARDRVPPGEADDYVPQFERYRIYVLPIGKFEKRGTVSAKTEIMREVLKRTLADSQIAKVDSYKELAEQYDALRVVADDGQRTKTFSKEFRVTMADCVALAVIVLSETRQKIVTSWIRSLRVVSDDPVQPEGCKKPGGVSRRVGPTIMPWFDTAEDPDAKARVGFIDFGEYAIGSYQKLRPADEEPLSWVLEGRLRDNLSRFTDFVNARVNASNFDMRESSAELWKVLFKCKDLDDRECDGIEALRRLRDLAEESPRARVQASFRDIEKNGTYYLPIHLLDAAGSLLALRFVQPFPVPPSAEARGAECVRDWSGSLIVEDIRFFDENGWRRGFFKTFVGAARHRLFREPESLDRLRDDYFGDTRLVSQAPEGLVLLAHHGDGDISDKANRDSLTRIKPGQVKRAFKSGSIALLVACSVGDLGDVEKGGSQFLFRLNEKNVRAAVISPFKVSPLLAQRFLENFKTIVENLKEETALLEVLEQTKKKFAEESSLGIQAAADVFMIVGDGDVKICKPGEKP